MVYTLWGTKNDWLGQSCHQRNKRFSGLYYILSMVSVVILSWKEKIDGEDNVVTKIFKDSW